MIEDRSAIHDCGLESKHKPAALSFFVQSSVGMRNWAFVGGHDVHSAGKGGAYMIDGRLPGDRVQRSQFDGRVGTRINQEVFDGFCGRSELRLKRKTARIDSGAVPGGMNAGNAERKLRLLAADKNGKRAADVAVSNQCEAQSIIVALEARLLGKRAKPKALQWI